MRGESLLKNSSAVPSNSILPRSKNKIRSATLWAKFILCVTMMSESRSLLRPPMTFKTSASSSGSSALVGSSKSKKYGFIASARAIATRCDWPPESLLGYSCSLPFSPTFSSSAKASISACSFGIFSTCTGPSVTFCRAVRCGNRLKL